MIGGQDRIPLDRDAARNFLPWLVAIVVFLAGLVVAGAVLASAVAGRWDAGLRGALTVQIRPLPDTTGAAAFPAQMDEALRILRDTPGVVAAEPLAPDALAALVAPWLGQGPLPADLPMPQLVDVRLAPGAVVGTDALEARLRAVAPGSVVDDHGTWAAEVLWLARVLQVGAAAVLAAVAAIAVLGIVYATRVGFATHAQAVSLMHLIGATDGYIAGQFQRRAVVLGALGAIAGGLVAAAAVHGVSLAVGGGAGFVGGAAAAPGLWPRIWGGLALVPVLAVVLVALTARWTALRELKRMP
ncbi:MAG TPA: FtsX-like permease family protein [Azospirillaceae bacterium]|nr:FtsX-like permease family protein [Azospirillaceae bacterium]